MGGRHVYPVRQDQGQSVQGVRGHLAAGGTIRVVLADEPKGWVALFCTDTSATVADRFSLEIAFRDCKDIVAAGRQQVRRVWASLDAFYVCLWAFTATEAWAWGPADAAWSCIGSRRPGPADKRRAWRRELLAREIHPARRTGRTEAEIQAAPERLLDIAA